MKATIKNILSELSVQVGVGILLIFVAAVYSIYLSVVVVVTIALLLYVMFDRAATKIANAVQSALNLGPKL